MKYVRYDAPPELRLRFHFRDKFGRDIERARDYDPVTGIGHRAVPESDTLLEFFCHAGYVEIDGHVNPNQETLDMLYSEVQQRGITDSSIMDQSIKKSEQDVRFKEGQAEQHQDEPISEPQS